MNLGIKTVAINKDTPPTQKAIITKVITPYLSLLMYLTRSQDVLRGFYQHIVVSPEQCARSCPEDPMFSRLLENQAFRDRIKCVNYDEAHFIVTAGEPDKEGNVFRPEYARGYDLLIRLRAGTPCTLFSATMPQMILDKVMKSLRLPTSTSKTTYLNLTTNRPNLCFAVQQLTTPVSRLSNLDFILPTNYHPPMTPLPKTLIFVPTTDFSIDLERRFNKMFPGIRIAQRIHASLTPEWKSQIIENYTGLESKPPILITTSLLSNVSLQLQ